MMKKPKKQANCPYCSSPNCNLGLNDFVGKKQKIAAKKDEEKIPCFNCQGGGCPICSGYGFLPPNPTN